MMNDSDATTLIDLDFDGQNTLYATHGLHAYAAKCPPQLAKFGIVNYSQPGDVVLDPMAGSGTTLLEACLLGRHVIGFDIDPLSCLIARVKVRSLDDKEIKKAFIILKKRLEHSLSGIDSPSSPGDYESYFPSEFQYLDYWFTPEVKKKLAVLRMQISKTPMTEEIREFFWVAFSAIILTKVSVANARDIIHSRHHFFKHKSPPDVIAKFERRVNLMRKQMWEYRALVGSNQATRVEMHQGDVRNLPIDSNSIDLVLTSPPYATALDYPRAHFLAVGWMEEVLGVRLSEYKARGATYIGSERGKININSKRDEQLVNTTLAHSVIDRLASINVRQGRLVQQYFVDMLKALDEIQRVLKVGGHAVIIVCPSHIRKVEVPTHKIFEQMGSSLGLELINEYTRTINANRRVLPYVRGSFGNRMSTEYVLVFKKNGKS